MWLQRRPSLGLRSTEPSRILQQHCTSQLGSRLKIPFPVLIHPCKFYCKYIVNDLEFSHLFTRNVHRTSRLSFPCLSLGIKSLLTWWTGCLLFFLTTTDWNSSCEVCFSTVYLPMCNLTFSGRGFQTRELKSWKLTSCSRARSCPLWTFSPTFRTTQCR